MSVWKSVGDGLTGKAESGVWCVVVWCLCMVSMVLVLWGFTAILGNGYGNQGQNYVALLPGSEMSPGFFHRNLILSA